MCDERRSISEIGLEVIVARHTWLSRLFPGTPSAVLDSRSEVET